MHDLFRFETAARSSRILHSRKSTDVQQTCLQIQLHDPGCEVSVWRKTHIRREIKTPRDDFMLPLRDGEPVPAHQRQSGGWSLPQGATNKPHACLCLEFRTTANQWSAVPWNDVSPRWQSPSPPAIYRTFSLVCAQRPKDWGLFSSSIFFMQRCAQIISIIEIYPPDCIR